MDTTGRALGVEKFLNAGTKHEVDLVECATCVKQNTINPGTENVEAVYHRMRSPVSSILNGH